MRPISLLSDRLADLERRLLIACIAAILGLILLNVATRAASASLYWVDETAVFVMVFACFIGTSLMVRKRMDFAVTLLTDMLPAPLRAWIQCVVALITLAFAVMLGGLCWRWFDPGTMMRLGFDEKAFFRETFNNIYREKTSTTGTLKIWFFLAMPWFAFTLTVHALANLLEDLAAAFGRRHAVVHREAAL
jgi:TRAP-type C4-dicarboxylate transport system permease small subunit